MTDLLKPSLSRRAVLQTVVAGAIGISPALHSVVDAAGCDAPERTGVKIGFIPLTYSANIVRASVLDIDKKYGIKIIPTAKSPAGPASATRS